MYVDASSPEEFAALLMSRHGFGLDTVNWEVLPYPRGAEGEVCRGRPPLPVVRHSQRGKLRKESGGEVLAKGVYWFRPLGILKRGREWEIASSCKRKPPLTGWERVSADIAAEVLLAHAQSHFYKYWPRGLPTSTEELRHVAVFGISMAGKTTFTKKALAELGRFYVLDITTHGEYSDLAPVHQGSVSLSQFTVDELAKLYTVAMAAVIGEEEKASFTSVQVGVLRMFAQYLSDLSSLIMAIKTSPEVLEMTKRVLVAKLSALCEQVTEADCAPHKLLSTPFEPPPPPAVIRIDPSNQAAAAFVVHGIVQLLLKRQHPAPIYVVIDEFHKVMPKVKVEDPVMEAVVAGRHRNVYVWVSTQSPRHLREDVLAVFPTQVFFQLREDADVAAKLLGVPEEALVSLRTGEWLAVTPAGRRRSP
ncbi:MAG: hypothetical protein QXI84_09235 [Thermofilaceae archaeon]